MEKSRGQINHPLTGGTASLKLTSIRSLINNARMHNNGEFMDNDLKTSMLDTNGQFPLSIAKMAPRFLYIEHQL